MKILLVGEFSRLHNSLKEGLIKNGHDVTLIGRGDGFKNFKTDINISSKIKTNKWLSAFNSLIIRLLNIDIIKIENTLRIKKVLPKLKNYDVVQLINEDAFFIKPKKQIEILKKLSLQNKNLFLLCCGYDYLTVKYSLENNIRYSVLTPYIDDPNLKKKYIYALKYNTPLYKQLHKFIKKNCLGTIATDLDYHIPMKNQKHYLGMIPNPINHKLITYIPIPIEDKIIIFHGINTRSKLKKGSIFFEKALDLLQQKYPNKILIKVTEDLPYNTYIKIYNSAHIVLDQTYSFDQGYNALEAMAKGKVVFTGAENEWLNYYDLKEDTIAINALPDADTIYKKLEWLILNPEKIVEISKNARQFIEEHHDYITIAKRYVSTWESSILSNH